jgi:acetyl-CoA/propionyl-CoA carboxylase biotin carboxyl carrier protein
MNTRLQVEHPVTEMVTGRDLVADQLRIAAGERLDVADSGAIAHTGHAIEVRLYAEDAEDGFLPATGRIEALRWPAGEGIRVDAGIELGSEIGGRFDPMLAKIVVWGPDRAAAFERLARALDATVVLGVVTNLRFLRWLVRQPVVLDGQARTDVLTRIWPPDAWAEMTDVPEAAWASAAATLIADPDPGDPWAGGWRLNASRSVRIESDGTTRTIDVADPNPDAESAFASIRAGDTVHLDLAGRSVAFRLAPAPDVDTAARAAAAHGAAGSTGPAEVVAPMPGAVLTVHVATGQTVSAGDPIVTLEAMKMEHIVVASIAGSVGEVPVRPAEQVTRGQLLAVVEP